MNIPKDMSSGIISLLSSFSRITVTGFPLSQWPVSDLSWSQVLGHVSCVRNGFPTHGVGLRSGQKVVDYFLSIYAAIAPVLQGSHCWSQGL